MSKILRLGILGCGSYARQHARVLQALGDQVTLAACSDRHPERAAALSMEFTGGNAAVFTSHQDLIQQAGLDLLVITLPPYGHQDEVALAAEKGLHLLVEKPIALSSAAAWQMVAAAEAAGICTQVGFKFRFGAAIEQVKARLASGEAGRPGLFSARYFANALHAPWWRAREKSGGQLVEQAIHLLDLARYLMGEPVAVYSRQENLFHQDVPGYTIEDVSATVISFANGGLGVINATNAAIPNRWIHDYRLVAQNLTAEFSGPNQAVLYFTAEADRKPVEVSSRRDVLEAQMLDLLQAIRSAGQTRTPLREGALSLDLALKANESARTHAEVRL